MCNLLNPNYFMKRMYSLLLLALVFSFSACRKEEGVTPEAAPAKQPASLNAARISVDKNLYVIQGDNMYRINTTTYASSFLSGGWTGAAPLTMVSNNSTNSTLNLDIVYVQGGHLHRWNPTNSAYRNLGPNWGGTEAMTNNGYNAIYAVQGGKIWSANTFDGAFSMVSDGQWTGTSFMTYEKFYVLTVHNTELYRTQTSNGSTVLERPSATADNNNRLRVRDYFVKNGRLYRDWSMTSSSTPLGTADWTGAVSMTYVAGSIWISKGGSIWRVDPNTGQIIGQQVNNLPSATWLGSFEAEIY